MFRAIILPIFRSTILCVTACGIMNPRCCRPVAGWQHRGCIIPQAVTQSGAPEDEQNNCPKNVELTGIINKPLLLHLVGCLYYLYFIIYFLRLAQQSQFILLQNVVYLITIPFLVRKIFTFYINDVLIFNVHFQGQRVNLKISIYILFFSFLKLSHDSPGQTLRAPGG